MAELTPRERLQPALLDRLTDHEPQKTEEPISERVLNMRRLRRSVLRDLAWLLNTVNYHCAHSLDGYPFVARSVLNYGLPELTGRIVANMTPKPWKRWSGRQFSISSQGSCRIPFAFARWSARIR
jgi:type VI secretion system protein ImpF